MLIPAGIDANTNSKLEMIADLYTDFKGRQSFLEQQVMVQMDKLHLHK